MTRTVSSTRLTSIWRVVLRKPVLSINYRGGPGYGVDFRAANGSGLGSGWQGASREQGPDLRRKEDPLTLRFLGKAHRTTAGCKTHQTVTVLQTSS